MKKLTILLFSIFISFNSYGEWTKVTETVLGDTFYIEKDRIKEHNGYVYYWRLIDYLKPDSFGDMSSKVYTQGDCGVNRIKYLSLIFYKQPMGKGEDEHNPLNTEWKYPLPDSAMESLLDYACSYIK